MSTERREHQIDELLREHASTLPKSARAALSRALGQLVEAELRAAGERTVGLCLRRGDLWQKTSQRGGHLADEARGRANEALYLADMIESGQDLPDVESSGGGAGGGGIQARGFEDSNA